MSDWNTSIIEEFRAPADPAAKRTAHHPGCPGLAVHPAGRLARGSEHDHPQAGRVPWHPRLRRRAWAAPVNPIGRCSGTGPPPLWLSTRPPYRRWNRHCRYHHRRTRPRLSAELGRRHQIRNPPMSTILARPTEIDAVASALRAAGSVRVPLDHLWTLWAVARATTGREPVQAAALADALHDLAVQGVVELPAAAWDTSTVPPLPRSVLSRPPGGRHATGNGSDSRGVPNSAGWPRCRRYPGRGYVTSSSSTTGWSAPTAGKCPWYRYGTGQ